VIASATKHLASSHGDRERGGKQSDRKSARRHRAVAPRGRARPSRRAGGFSGPRVRSAPNSSRGVAGGGEKTRPRRAEVPHGANFGLNSRGLDFFCCGKFVLTGVWVVN
jgi:hypothetical protein